MSTRALVGIKTDSHGIMAISVHNDGSPDVVGARLKEHYNDFHKVVNLLNLGDLSSVHPLVDPIAGDPRRACVACHRDQGQAFHGAIPCGNSITDLMKEGAAADCSFVYLFCPESAYWMTGQIKPVGSAR